MQQYQELLDLMKQHAALEFNYANAEKIMAAIKECEAKIKRIKEGK